MITDRVSPSGVAINRQNNLTRLQNELATLTAEMSSGRKSDPTRELGVGASLLYKLYGDVQQGEAIKNSTSLAGKRIEAMQTALTQVGDLMDQMSPEILKTDSLKGNGYTIIASNAREMLGSMIDLLNTSWDGQNIFGGTDSSQPPLANSSTLLDWAQTQLDDAVTAAGDALDETEAAALITTFDTMFANETRDTSNSFYGLVYQSTSRTSMGSSADPESDTDTLIRIGAGETLSYNVRADNQTFKDAFKSLAILSTLDASSSELSEDAKTALIDEAGELMRGARSQLTVLAGVLGGKQERLEKVATIQDKAVTAATAQINDLEGADYYTISDKVSTLQIQLNATYAITAKLAELSLVNYL
ncbi:flagellin [Roseomonas sp. GC11]|uniref:flagellin N-terminal helical domain-containing protein n=1 Tax=Roseomonas sp. GC11 TaxID=2950546 RepID=UPI00210AC809|nr:flagellin [Roseomonas sp. GC11]MCQ4159923.1 flagellin [Roseomonas sp. GC11]